MQLLSRRIYDDQNRVIEKLKNDFQTYIYNSNKFIKSHREEQQQEIQKLQNQFDQIYREKNNVNNIFFK